MSVHNSLFVFLDKNLYNTYGKKKVDEVFWQKSTGKGNNWDLANETNPWNRIDLKSVGTTNYDKMS